jgi:death-on-curing family protein
MNNKNTGKIVLYKSKGGELSVDVKLYEETVWLTQKQIAELFGKDVRTISEHIKHIFEEGELEEGAAVRKFRITAADGKGYETNFYNLDAIISIGYRVNSTQATRFRIWATQILGDYLVKGYVLNQKRLQEKGLYEFEQAVALIKSAADTKGLTDDERSGLLDVITNYAQSWILLQKYDEQKLGKPKGKKGVKYVLTYDEALESIIELKKDLVGKREAGDIFGNESNGCLEGIIGNVYQTFDGEDLYSSIEEMAANLLYFIVKDHLFVDGNKRIGALLFIVFLLRNDYLLKMSGEKKINDNALVAVVLLVAESDPRQKEVMVNLIMNLITGD